MVHVGERPDAFRAMFWRAAAVELGFAALVLISPALFDSPVYGPIRPFLGVLAALALLGGGLAAAEVSGSLPARFRPLAPIAAALPLALLAANFAFTGTVTGVLAYAIEAASFLVTATLIARGAATHARVYLLMVGAILVMQGLSMIFTPDIYANAQTYADLARYLWVTAPLFLVGGVGLLVCELRMARDPSQRGEKLLLTFAAVAGIDLAMLVNVFATSGAWTGVLSYGVMAVLLLLAAPRGVAAVASPILFASMAAVAAIGDIGVGVMSVVGLPLPAPAWTLMRPSLALGTCYVAIALALALHPRRPLRRLGVTLAGTAALAGALGIANALVRGPATGADRLLGLVPDDDLSVQTIAGPVCLVAAAILVLFVWVRPHSRLVPPIFVIAGSALLGVVALNLLAFMLRSPFLFDIYGPLSLRAHSTVALGALGLALLGGAIARLVAAPIGDRLFGTLGALTALILIRGYIADAALAHVFVDISDAWNLRFLDAVNDARALTLMLLIAIGSAATLMLVRTVTMPLRQVIDGISRARAGEARVHVSVANDDEIGIVARSFNELTEQLADESDFNEAVQRAQSDLGEALLIFEDGRPRRWNDALPKITGYSDDELRAMPILDLVPADARTEIERTSAAHRGETYRFETTIRRGDGARADVEVAVIPLRGAARATTRLAVVRDITERKSAERSLERVALYDSVTDLPNRALFAERVQRTIDAAPLRSEPFTILYLDLDRFKEINDAFGHDAGDEVLREIARRLSGHLSGTGTVARFGGDEFAILLPDARDAVEAFGHAEVIRAVLLRPFEVLGHHVFIEASIGVVCFPAHGTDAETLLRRADVAMYQAKRTGKGLTTYSAEHDPQNQHRLELMSDLRNAIERNELLLHFQPQIRLARGGSCESVEALVRWKHPVRGMVAPGEFISIAEESGFINQLTLWVVREAAAAGARLGARALRPRLAVNVSARDLHYPGLVEAIDDALGSAQLDARMLTIEITETAVMTDTQRSLETLARLSALGVRLSIDDFGAGYSSLAYLRRLPVNELKIDRMFVADMIANPSSDAIVTSVIQLGHSLGLTLVAEGVEDAATLAALRAARCDFAQGYAIARPMPLADLEVWLAARRQSVELSDAAD